MNRTALAAVWPPTARIADAAGHRPISPIEAIRRKCIDCCGGQMNEVRLCEAVGCALWPFRAGRHPYTKTRLQEADPGEGCVGGTPTPADGASAPTRPHGASSGQGGHIRPDGSDDAALPATRGQDEA